MSTFKTFLDKFDEDTVSADVAGTGDGFDKKKILKKKKPIEVTEASKWERSIQDMLIDALDREVDNIKSYSDAGLMTRDAGVVIRHEGKEYQLTIVES